MFRKQTRIACAIAAAIGSVSASHAQIEEVLVTAQKRSESAQDVPVALSAVTGETIAKLGLGNMADLTKVSSSLTIQDNGNRNEAPVSLRGIGTYSFAIGVEPSVSVIVDEVPVATTGQAFSNLSDLQRVEVLRGPQSTLFGKNASAGVINLVTNDPSDEFEGSVTGEMTDDDYYRVSGILSGPISDTVGFRVSAYYDDFDGNMNNVYNGDTLQASESQGVRAKLKFDPSDALSVTLAAEYNELDQTMAALAYRTVDPNSKFLGFLPQSVWLGDIEPGDDNFDVAQDTTPRSKSEDSLFSAKIDYQIGEATLTSVTGFRKWEYWNTTDLDGIGSIGIFPSSLDQSSYYEIEQFTQEVRLASPSSDTFEYIVGLFYSDSDYDRTFVRGPIARSDWSAYAGNEAYSVFGQGTFYVTDALRVIAGLRYQKEEIEVDFTNNLSGTNPKGSDSDDVVVGRLVAQYDISEDVMVYASYARGYKGQAYNTTSSFNQEQADNPVGTEDSDAYEIGMKGMFADGRVQLNMAVFDVTYEGFQAQSARQNAGGALEFTLNNVGEVETSGVEVDVIALITDNLQLNLGAAYTDATINDFTGAECWSGQTAEQGCVGGQQDLSGADLNNSPDWKYVVGLDYTLELPSTPLDVVLTANYQWQDDVNFSLLSDPSTTFDSYGILNLSAGLQSRDGKYSVTAFVNNAADEFYVSSVSNLSFLYGATTTGQIVPRYAERFFGVRGTFNF